MDYDKGNRMKTYIIAEAGINSNGDIAKAKEMVKVAKDCGADCIKFQYFYESEVREVWDIINDYRLEWGYLSLLEEYCRNYEIDFLCSAFGKPSAWILCNRLKQKAIKIPSGKITDLDFLEYISDKFDRFYLSTGMANMDEIIEAVKALKCKVDLLHCISSYPAPLDELNLSVLRCDLFNGFSDHTLDTRTGAWAVMAGASIIEKHFTLDRFMDGPDHKMSLTPTGLKEYIYNIRVAEQVLGNGIKKCEECERPLLFRRK